MRERLSVFRMPATLVASVLAAMFLLTGPLHAQGKGKQTVYIHDTVTVTKYVHDTVTVTKTVTVVDTLRLVDTVRVRVTDTVRVTPTLAILAADTAVFTRVAGDTTFTTTRIIQTEGVVDTLATMTYVVKLPPPPTANPLDSVTFAVPHVPTYATADTMKLTTDVRAWPYPYPYTAAYQNIRWLFNGAQVGSSIQVKPYTTVQFPRPVGRQGSFVACSTIKGGTLAASAEVCSGPVPYTDRAYVAAPDTIVVTPVPPADTGAAIVGDTAAGGLLSLGFGTVHYDSVTKQAWVPTWATYAKATPDARLIVGWAVEDSASLAKGTPRVTGMVIGFDTLPRLPTEPGFVRLPLYRPAAGSPFFVDPGSIAVPNDGLSRKVTVCAHADRGEFGTYAVRCVYGTTASGGTVGPPGWETFSGMDARTWDTLFGAVP